MTSRIAATLSLVAFAMCLLIGIQAGNSFATTIQRALVAMAGTYVIGLIVGAMGQRMLDENVKAEEQKLKDVK
jgi:NhaP-type Na+/H+ or K+/H+ antiporter